MGRRRVKLVPWSHVKYWACVRCGGCCRHTIVQLTPPEWLMIVKAYGYGLVDQTLSGFYLRKTIDDHCPFLAKSLWGYACQLQHTKPLACKLWPFRIRGDSRLGYEDEAHLKYRGRDFYVYAQPQCPGIVVGTPSPWFTQTVLPEFLDIRLGLQKEQIHSTSKRHPTPY
jgi:Fe-S-cluster containining protein